MPDKDFTYNQFIYDTDGLKEKILQDILDFEEKYNCSIYDLSVFELTNTYTDYKPIKKVEFVTIPRNY